MAHIGQTLDMIRTQTFPQSDMETIIFLDGCSDDTAGVVMQYAKSHQDMNIKAVQCTENQGPANARNSALEYARGEYIHFLDADDIINTDFYASLYDGATRTNSDVAVAGCVNDTIGVKYETILSNHADKLDYTHVDTTCCLGRYLIRRKFWQYNKFKFPTHMRYCEDMAVMTKTIYYSNQIVIVPNSVYTHKNKIKSKYHHSACVDAYIFLAQMGTRRSIYPVTQTWYKLFDIVPFIRATNSIDDTWIKYRLLGFIPLFKVSRRTTYKQWSLK